MPPAIRLSYLYLLIFILIPGYVCLRGYLRGNLVLDDQDRTDKFIVILIGGFTSLCITVILYRVNIQWWSEFIYTSITTLSVATDLTQIPFNGPVMVNTNGERSILKIAGILTVESGIGGVIGFIYGRLKLPPEDRIEASRSRRELRQPWEEVFNYATLDTEATVITTNGEEIQGKIEQIGSPSEDYDILLADPHKVIRGPGDRVISERKIGLHSYHHYRDISRVAFKSGFDYPQDNRSFLKTVQKRILDEFSWLGKKLRSIIPEISRHDALTQSETDSEQGQATSLTMTENEESEDEDSQ